MNYTIAFDVYGTLINTSGVFDSLEKMIGSQAEAFMNTWRNKQLEYSFRRGLMDKHTDFSVCTRDALAFACQTYGIDLSPEQRAALMREYTVLPSFPDVEEGLMALKGSGHRLYAFSNGSQKAVTQLLNHAKIIDHFDGVISVEGVATFKPNPLVYQHFNQQTNSQKSNSFLISGNPFDVIGAISYGMRAIWVQRSPKKVFDPWGMDPTATIPNLKELASVLENLSK